MTFVVGLTAPDCTGKTTTAMAIKACDNDEHWIELDAFANPLYGALSAMTGCPVAFIKKYKDVPVPPNEAPIPCIAGRKFRDFLRTLGTEYARNVIHNDIWVELADMRARDQDDVDVYIFDDLRLPNEAGICDLVIELRREGVEYPNTHSSSFRIPDHMIDVTYWLTPGDPGRDASRLIPLILKRKELHASQAK